MAPLLSALHHAGGGGKVEMVKLLLLKGADKDALDNSKHTPFMWPSITKTMAAALQTLNSPGCGRERHPSVRPPLRVRSAQDRGTGIRQGGDRARSGLRGCEHDPTDTSPHCRTGDRCARGAGSGLEARNRFGGTPFVAGTVAAALDAMSALLEHSVNVNARCTRGEGKGKGNHDQRGAERRMWTCC